ncbi:DUF2931 family protein [Flavobacterium psychrophilum]|nr:DUF2931 family protein [Flavobacterium psychrophilum]
MRLQDTEFQYLEQYLINIFYLNNYTQRVNFNGDLNKELYGTDNYEWGKGESGIHFAEYVLPDSLKLTWCSLIEKRFYTINVALDKKKIETLFRKDIFRKSDGIITKEKYH